MLLMQVASTCTFVYTVISCTQSEYWVWGSRGGHKLQPISYEAIPNFFTPKEANLPSKSELSRIAKRKTLLIGKSYLTELLVSGLCYRRFARGASIIVPPERLWTLASPAPKRGPER